MIPGRYDLKIYRGDTYYGPLITLPDLSPFGGPVDLTTATVTAQVRENEDAAGALAEFAVSMIDPALRQIRLRLTPTQTAAIAVDKTVWDMQVSDSGWVGTPLAGKVKAAGEVTR
jgi:hypothetical protein